MKKYPRGRCQAVEAPPTRSRWLLLHFSPWLPVLTKKILKQKYEKKKHRKLLLINVREACIFNLIPSKRWINYSQFE